MALAPAPAVGLAFCDCLTPLGSAAETQAALAAGRIALAPVALAPPERLEAVPLARIAEPATPRPPGEPRWLPALRSLVARIPGEGWGEPRRPVLLTSSNYGIDSLYAWKRQPSAERLPYILPHRLTEVFRREFGWGSSLLHFSHACVSSNLGLLHAARLLGAGLAERVLVLTYDFLSPFVALGFNALKILTETSPAPYEKRDYGAIGLGDGAAAAVLTTETAPFRLELHGSHNELFHATGNHPDGLGFREIARPVAAALRGRRLWIKGHGTGTLEAGRLEAEQMAAAFPGAPLVSWKGSLGHTLGSCGLVELAVTQRCVETGVVPGTLGTRGECFSAEVAREAFDAGPYDAVALNSSAFGGAHHTVVLSYG